MLKHPKAAFLGYTTLQAAYITSFGVPFGSCQRYGFKGMEVWKIKLQDLYVSTLIQAHEIEKSNYEIFVSRLITSFNSSQWNQQVATCFKSN